MIKSITISNFKRFSKPIKIDFWNHKSKKEGQDFIIGDHISSVIGIIGKNATGKTSILEAINFYSDLNSEWFLSSLAEKVYIEKINKLIKKSHEPSTPIEKRTKIKKQYREMMANFDAPNSEVPILKPEIDHLFFKKYQKAASSISQPIFFMVEYYDNGKLLVHELNVYDSAIQERITLNGKKEIHKSKSSIYSFKSKILPMMKAKKLSTVSLINFTRLNNKNSEWIIQDQMAKDPDLFKTFLKTTDETIDDFTFDSSGKKPVAYISKDNTRALDFSTLSRGTHIMIILYEHLYHALFEKRALLLIDEIENSLHFKLIKFIITIFKKRYNKLSSQLIFSTHNPFIFDDNFKSNSVYFIEGSKLLQNEERFDKKIAPGYLRGELASIPNYKYRFQFFDAVISNNEKNN